MAINSIINPIVDVRHVSVSLSGRTILRDVSLMCYPGQWTVIVGENGSGKSTLLRTINGLCMPQSGCVHVMGTCIPGRSRGEARRVWRQTGTVLQNAPLFSTKTVRQNVQLACNQRMFNRSVCSKRVNQWLAHLELLDKANSYPSVLSGGERQRVALARAFLNSPPLLVLDEPLVAVDAQKIIGILDMIKKFSQGGSAVIMSTHHIELLNDLFDQLIVLRGGVVERNEYY